MATANTRMENAAATSTGMDLNAKYQSISAK